MQFLVTVFFERLVTNGGAIAAKARCHPAGKVIAVDFVSRQLSVLLVDYRGYGWSEGRPSEKGLYLDGAAAYGFAADQLGGARNVVLFGSSLGAAVATHVASRSEVGCLVLEAPFTSLDEIAAAVYPFLPSFLFRRLRGKLDTHRAKRCL